ncbi:MAG TPA: hypothetical protein VF240_09835 [Pyrinomonadaceae bacterium]
MNYFNYYTEIEDTFVRRRGKHLLLSPLDWALIESWRTMGVPLHVALRGIEKSFDSYEARPRNRSVKSLFYCQEEVEAQYADWLEMQRGAAALPGQTVSADGVVTAAGATAEGEGREVETSARLPFPRAVIAGHLAESRAAVERAAVERRGGAGAAGADELSEALERVSSRLSELERDFGAAARPDAEQLEAALTDLEGLIDRAVRAGIGADALASARAEAEGQLRPYRARMDVAVYETTLENILAKALRERFRLPRLSLFHL